MADTLAPQTIFNDVFIGQPAAPAYVVLAQGTVYRIEAEPAAARIAIRQARRPGMPPLFLVPLDDRSGPAGGAAYLLVPNRSAEYRLDVETAGDEPVRVRILTDPAENARLTRIRRDGFRLPLLGAAVRAGYLATFRDAYATPNDSLYGYHTEPHAATGVEGCLRVVPSGRVLPARVGGCAVTVGFWRRPAGRDFRMIGIAPEVVLRRAGSRSIALSPEIAFGSTRGGRPRAQYVFLALGLRYAVRMPGPGSPPLAWEFSGSLVNVRSLPSALDYRRVSTLTLRLGAGLLLNP